MAEQVRLIVYRELLFPEQVRAFTIAAAAELLHQLCLSGELSDEQAALIWQTCNLGLKEYSEEKLPILQLVPLIDRFRRNTILFSDSSLLSPLFPELRPAVAYLLAQRLLVKTEDELASRKCLEIAINCSAEGGLARKLAQEGLSKRPPK